MGEEEILFPLSLYMNFTRTRLAEIKKIVILANQHLQKTFGFEVRIC